MPDSYTAFLNLTKPEVGGSPNTWGTKFNANLDKIDAGVKAANDLAAAAFPKAGGTNITGDFNLSKANPQFGFAAANPGKPQDGKRWGLLHFEDGSFYFQHTDMPADNPVRFTPAGNIILAGAYDVKAQIAAAAAAGTAALNAAVKKTGDVMTGELMLDGPNALGRSQNLRFLYEGVGDWKIRVIGGNRLQICDGGETAEIISIGTGGDISTRQFGDLNGRIEARASAYSQNFNAATYNACASSMRMVYAGDLYNSWNLNGGMAEPYAGSLISSRATIADGTANGAWIPGIFRWRYVQYYNPNQGGWVTAGYA
jgi:hypothetical protein